MSSAHGHNAQALRRIEPLFMVSVLTRNNRTLVELHSVNGYVPIKYSCLWVSPDVVLDHLANDPDLVLVLLQRCQGLFDVGACGECESNDIYSIPDPPLTRSLNDKAPVGA